MDLGSIIVTTLFILFIALTVWLLTFLFGALSWIPLLAGVPLGYGIGMLLIWLLGKTGNSGK